MALQDLNILLVEDDDVDVMNVKRAFRRNNISTPLYVAKNGLEGLAMLRGDPNDEGLPRDRRMILLDLNMPRMNGIEFLEALRQDPHLSTTPVVVLTTSNADRDRLAAYRYNVAGYILKPVQFASFADTMVALSNYWTLCELP
ncbi:response regulator [Leptolyngbya sp. PCC 6406]|uniref:response regulator n=1 Tax=Leptolyngbya sp. PCC 6406 TaxID=1173264 RepID=UPI0002ABAC8B|nr:response regulator [Leptolyngbya sp. PCC 6406]